MTVLFNQVWSRERRKELRAKSTEAEKVLWDLVRNRKLLNIKFRREYGVGTYIVDFYAPQLKLAIEVDGMAHENAEARSYDKVRDEYLEDVGIQVKRYKNYEVLYSPDSVRDRLIAVIMDRMARSPSLPRRG